METINNDRFKFRVWDDTHKEYLPLCDCKLDARNGKIVKQSLFQENRYIIEQCTGLRDKNGKLIHANDVVRFYWKEQAPQEFIVKWNHHRCCFDFYVYKNHKRGCKFGQWYWCFDSGECKYCEIIGNIHDGKFRDNTKLIEEKE